MFHNPHLQPEDVRIDFSDLSPFARLIQRSWRRKQAVTRISAVIKGWLARMWLLVKTSNPDGSRDLQHYRIGYLIHGDSDMGPDMYATLAPPLVRRRRSILHEMRHFRTYSRIFGVHSGEFAMR